METQQLDSETDIHYSRTMTPLSRRKLLNDRMDSLEKGGFSCQGCQGTCCTYEANSMMVTPLEAFDILNHLKVSNKKVPELKQRLQDTIGQYRLDSALGNGKKSFLRRTYTCPFFNHQELGCPLPREIKPYGCLAFNSHHKEDKAGAECYSEKEILAERENLFLREEQLNEKLRSKYKLFWEKSTIPGALVEIWDADFSDADLELN